MTYDKENQDKKCFIFNLTNKYSNNIQINDLLIDVSSLIVIYLKVPHSDKFG